MSAAWTQEFTGAHANRNMQMGHTDTLLRWELSVFLVNGHMQQQTLWSFPDVSALAELTTDNDIWLQCSAALTAPPRTLRAEETLKIWNISPLCLSRLPLSPRLAPLPSSACVCSPFLSSFTFVSSPLLHLSPFLLSLLLLPPLSSPCVSSLVSFCYVPPFFPISPLSSPCVSSFVSSLVSLCLLSRLLVCPISSFCLLLLLFVFSQLFVCSSFLLSPFFSLPPSFPFSPLLSPSVSSLSPLFFSFVSSISFCFVSSPRVFFHFVFILISSCLLSPCFLSLLLSFSLLSPPSFSSVFSVFFLSPLSSPCVSSFFPLSPLLFPYVSSLLFLCLLSCFSVSSLSTFLFFCLFLSPFVLSLIFSPCVPLFFPFVSSLVSSCVLPPLPLPPLSSFHHLSPPPLLRWAKRRRSKSRRQSSASVSLFEGGKRWVTLMQPGTVVLISF